MHFLIILAAVAVISATAGYRSGRRRGHADVRGAARFLGGLLGVRRGPQD